MTSQPQCIVHIGAPKTGSTLLQRVLFESRDLLAARGYLYPDVSLRGYGHHDLAFLVGGGYPDWATPQPRSLDELVSALANAASFEGSILLSSEDFYLCPNPEGVRRVLATSGLLAGRDCRIVVYLRRQDDAHESWFNQTTKAQGYTHTPGESVSAFRELWDYKHQLARWEDVFPSSLVVRPFERESFHNGLLLDDFLAVLGLTRANVRVPAETINTSINRDLLEFQRILNRLPLEPAKRRRFHHQLMALTEATKDSTLFDRRPVFDASIRRRILEDYAASNRSVARKYLNREALFTNLEIAADETAPVPEGLTVEKLAAIFAWLMVRDE